MIELTGRNIIKLCLIGLVILTYNQILLKAGPPHLSPFKLPVAGGPTPITPFPTRNPSVTPKVVIATPISVGTPIPLPTRTRIPDYVPPTTVPRLAGKGTAYGWYHAPIELTFVVTDDYIGFTEYRLDGATDWIHWEYCYPPIVFAAEGSHLLEYRSIDKVLNVEPVQTTTINLDLTSPTATHTLTGTQLANGWYTPSLTITFSGQDNLAGIDYYDLDLDGQNWFTVTTTYVVTAFGQHSLTYRGVDRAGNLSKPAVITFAIAPKDIVYLPLIFKHPLRDASRNRYR